MTEPVQAGPGLLRSGTSLSINPVQKLKSLSVRDKITVPEPIDNYDAATKAYVDVSMMKAGPTIGEGLVVGAGNSISLAREVTVDSIRLTGGITRNDQVVTKEYIDQTVAGLASRATLQNSISDMVKRGQLENALTSFASRSYVLSVVTDCATQKQLQELREEYALKSYVDSQVSSLPTYLHLTNALKHHVRRDEFEAQVSKSVPREYLDSKIKSFASKWELEAALATVTKTTTFNSALSDLVSKAELSRVVEDTKVEPGAGIEREGSVLSVSSALPNLHLTGPLRSLTVEGPSRLSTETHTPFENELVTIGHSTFVIIDPAVPLTNVTLTFPGNPQNGHYLIITTSRDLENVTLQNIPTVGDIRVPDFITMTAGMALRFVYVSSIKAWFAL